MAGHHHGLVWIEQEGGCDVLASQGGEGHRIGAQIFEQVVGQGRGGVEIAVFGVDDQGEIAGHQVPHLQQQLQSHRPKGLIKTKAGLVGADMGRCGLDHRLNPVAGLAEEGAARQAPPRCPALQHLRVWIKPGHQQRLAVGDGVGEFDEEAHRPQAVRARC